MSWSRPPAAPTSAMKSKHAYLYDGLYVFADTSDTDMDKQVLACRDIDVKHGICTSFI